ncbi:MAG: AraC family transcriptional regulator [Bacteroidota bacterium]
MFPDYNFYSTTLLVLILQGLIFAALLLKRYIQERKLSDLFLFFIVLLTCYRTTTYVIGFMGWYDTFRNTKVNYFMLDTAFVIGPLIYFYLKTLTQPYFSFKKVHLWHFLPFTVEVTVALFVLIYDAQQPGFYDSQNGVLYRRFYMESGLISVVIGMVSQFIYYSMCITIYLNFRKEILQLFSNTYSVELNWLRNFLFIYIGLFLFNQIYFNVIGNFFVDLSWTQRWWWFFANALAVFYVGIRGYFSRADDLKELRIIPTISESTPSSANPTSSSELDTILEKMKNDRLYLSSQLTLASLAEQVDMSPNQVSSYINSGTGKNFNDFVNEFRVDAVKNALLEPQNAHLSILGIALDCGFNSKATFNRVFKKFTGCSPSQYLNELNKAPHV